VAQSQKQKLLIFFSYLVDFIRNTFTDILARYNPVCFVVQVYLRNLDFNELRGFLHSIGSLIDFVETLVEFIASEHACETASLCTFVVVLVGCKCGFLALQVISHEHSI
jgi:hypothetical protein